MIVGFVIQFLLACMATGRFGWMHEIPLRDGAVGVASCIAITDLDVLSVLSCIGLPLKDGRRDLDLASSCSLCILLTTSF